MDFLNVVRCCTPALPSAYADALSYYDALCKLQGAINEVIATLNTYTPVTEEWVKNYVTEQLNSIIKDIEDFESSVDGKSTIWKISMHNLRRKLMKNRWNN